MSEISIDSNAQEILRKFEKFPESIQTGILNGLKRGLIVSRQRVVSGSGIKSRTGSAGLMGRLTTYARRDSHFGVDAAIGFRKRNGFPYELSQEFGAKAKPGKAMAIPLTPKAKQFSSPRAFPSDLFIMKANGKAFLVEKRARSQVLQYVLVKSIPASLHFMANVKASMPELSYEVVKGYTEEMAKI